MRPTSAGSTPGRPAMTFALVPMVTDTSLARSMPAPSSMAGMSAAPVTTGMPAGSPNAAAGPGRRGPAIASVSRSRGSLSKAMPAAAARSSAKPQRPASNSMELPASVGSLATSPVIQRRSQSFGPRIAAVCAQTSGA